MGISTGCLAVDYIIGNAGFPRARISEIFGEPSSGKSTLAAMACAKAQKQGLYPVYLDVERGLDGVWASKLGFDVPAAKRGEKGLYLTPDTFEDMLIIVEALVKEGVADLIFVDSVAALVPEQYMKDAITDIGQLGVQARLFAAALPKLSKLIDRPDSCTALVFVNQVRANIQTGWQPPGAARNTAPIKGYGGWALAHYSTVRVQLKQLNPHAKTIERPSLTNPKKSEKVALAALHTAMAFKNKGATPYQKIEFYIRFDPEADLWGIDNLQTILDIAAGKGLIESKGGGYFLYNGAETMQVRGDEGVYNWFKAHPAEVLALRTKLGL